jgi:hypothetical protein
MRAAASRKIGPIGSEGAGSSEGASEAYLPLLNDLARSLVGREHPYVSNWQFAMWSLSMRHTQDTPEPAWPHWLLWGALTDRVEVHPDELADAEQSMHRAATEWLVIASQPGRWAAFFDHWPYVERGYERPSETS